MDDCLDRPCQNGGKCTDGINGYTCTCLDDYFGLHCQYGKLCKLYWHDSNLIIFVSFQNAHMPKCSVRQLSM